MLPEAVERAVSPPSFVHRAPPRPTLQIGPVRKSPRGSKGRAIAVGGGNPAKSLSRFAGRDFGQRLTRITGSSGFLKIFAEEPNPSPQPDEANSTLRSAARSP